MLKYILFWMAKPIGEMAIYLGLVVALIGLAIVLDWLDRKL